MNSSKREDEGLLHLLRLVLGRTFNAILTTSKERQLRR